MLITVHKSLIKIQGSFTFLMLERFRVTFSIKEKREIKFDNY